MRYRLEIKLTARKQIHRLPNPIRDRVMTAIARLAEHPRPPGTRKITGEDDAYRIRVGDYRIVYEVHDRVLIVYVVRVGHRKDVYRDL